MKSEEKTYNTSDQTIWNKVFSNIPDEWTHIEASGSMRDCLDYFKNNKVQTVLDLGCGIGIWSMYLSRSGLKVKGVDFSDNAIDYANNWAIKEGQKIDYACSPLTNHPFCEEVFDGIVAAKILDNISKREFVDVSDLIFSNLKNNGILYCLFNPYMTNEQLDNLEDSNNPTKGITLTIYSDKEIIQLFPKFKLLNLKHYEHGFRGLVLQKTK